MQDQDGPRDELTQRAAVAFGDNVRIRSTPETLAAGVADRLGIVFGLTTPSLGYAEDVIGDVHDDIAVNVNIEDLGRAVWIDPLLIEFVDHGAGVEVEIGDKRFVRTEDGGWKANGDD